MLCGQRYFNPLTTGILIVRLSACDITSMQQCPTSMAMTGPGYSKHLVSTG